MIKMSSNIAIDQGPRKLAVIRHAKILFGSSLLGLHRQHLLRLLCHVLCHRSQSALQLLQPLRSRYSDVRKQHHKQQLHPLLDHHENALHQQAFGKLRNDALEESTGSLVLIDVG